MQSNGMILLKNLLLSTSSRNILKHEKDKKRRSKIIGGYIGVSVLYILLVAYCLAMAIGYGAVGLTSAIPVLCALVLGALEFVFTIFKTNGYLFAFKEYDMLMSMPFPIKTVVSSKFLYMYVKNLPWIASISLSMLAGYAYYAKPGILTYILWIVLSLMLPVIPMILAAAIGSLIAGVGSGFRHKNIVQTILTFIFLLLCFFSRFFIEGFFKEIAADAYGKLKSVSDTTDKIKNIFLPAKWFEDAVVNTGLSSILLFIGITLLVYELFFIIVSKFYRRINSRLMSGIARRKYKMQALKTKSVTKSIAFKEFRRFVNSTLYLTNIGFGELGVVILCIVCLFVDMDGLMSAITSEAPFSKEALFPAIPLVIYFLTGMGSTTACSYSLEGKNMWIMQSLPISKKTLVNGKMLFNMYFTVPFTLLGNIIVGFTFKASVIEVLLFVICGLVLCSFSTAWGMRCDLKHFNLEWDNEVEVIKQGAAMTIYLLPNMFGTMLLIVGAVALGFVLKPIPVLLIILVLFAALALLSYRSTMKLCRE